MYHSRHPLLHQELSSQEKVAFDDKEASKKKICTIL
jgi:hypothetical protein